MNNIKNIKHNLKEDIIVKKRLESVYNSTTKEIEKEIYRVALNSIDEEGNISLQKIKTSKIKSAEIEEILTKIEEIKKEDIEDYVTDELNALNLNKRENGVRYLYDFIAFSIIKNMIKEKKIISKHLLISAQNELKLKEKEFNLTKDINVSKIVDKIILNSKFSNNIWINNQEFLEDIKKGLRRSLQRGENPKEWANRLKKYLKDKKDNAIYKTERLAITETTKAQIKTLLASYKLNGYTKIRWIAEPGACPICLPRDNKIYDIEFLDEEPPLHPHCKCSLSPYEPTEEELFEDIENGEFE